MTVRSWHFASTALAAATCCICVSVTGALAAHTIEPAPMTPTVEAMLIMADTNRMDRREDRRDDRRDDRDDLEDLRDDRDDLEDVRDARDDRGDDRQDCREEEGVGADKRDCKQDARRD